MIACMDVYYRQNSGVAACILIKEWTDSRGIMSCVNHIKNIEPYEPGRFYRRELSCLINMIDKITGSIDAILLDAILIDGYVWIGDKGSPGLGAYLYDALDNSVPVIGVAKSLFKGTENLAQKVLRGMSRRPLYITAAGIDPRVAADYIRRMHGAYRIPTLLKEVDRLSRSHSI